MREALQPYIGQRITIQGRVQRFGTRLGWNGSKLPTLLLGPVLDDQGIEITDHLWMRIGQRIALADPQPGDVLTLTGRVRGYTKRRKPIGPGPVVLERDLGLAYPTKCAVVKASTVREICPIGQTENVYARIHDTPPTESVDRYNRISLSSVVPTRARVLFALAVLSEEDTNGVSLTKLNARANVAPTAFLSQLKKLGNAGHISFTPTGRVLLAGMQNQAIGVAQ